jgi:hypothetical protein
MTMPASDRLPNVNRPLRSDVSEFDGGGDATLVSSATSCAEKIGIES